MPCFLALVRQQIFKTSILVFKDRDKYVSGEYRYRHGYCRSNPRKMVKVSAISVTLVLVSINSSCDAGAISSGRLGST
jgi:RIO1 family